MDTVSSSRSLVLTCKYDSGNNTTLIIPGNAATSADAINSLSEYIKNNQILLGNSQAAFSKIIAAKSVQRAITTLDIY